MFQRFRASTVQNSQLIDNITQNVLMKIIEDPLVFTPIVIPSSLNNPSDLRLLRENIQHSIADQGLEPTRFLITIEGNFLKITKISAFAQASAPPMPHNQSSAFGTNPLDAPPPYTPHASFAVPQPPTQLQITDLPPAYTPYANPAPGQASLPTGARPPRRPTSPNEKCRIS